MAGQRGYVNKVGIAPLPKEYVDSVRKSHYDANAKAGMSQAVADSRWTELMGQWGDRANDDYRERWNAEEAKNIEPTAPPASQNPTPVTPQNAAGGGGLPSSPLQGNKNPDAALNGLVAAGNQATMNVGTPSPANPSLGRRTPAIDGLTLAMQKPRNY